MTLFWKLFASIGVAMVVTLVATVYVSYELASATFNQVDIEGREPIIQEAALVLAQRGERGLREWLRDHSREASRDMVLLIIDENGRELLGRAMPGEVRRLLEGGPQRGHLLEAVLRQRPTARHQRMGGQASALEIGEHLAVVAEDGARSRRVDVGAQR